RGRPRRRVGARPGRHESAAAAGRRAGCGRDARRAARQGAPRRRARIAGRRRRTPRRHDPRVRTPHGTAWPAARIDRDQPAACRRWRRRGARRRGRLAMRTAFTKLVGVEHPLVGFNRSPAVVVEVSRAGALGVLAATAYRPEELDAQLTWIEERVGGKPYGVDLLIPAKLAAGDPDDLIASLRAQIPEE